jgi:hypothetical protein
MTISLNIYNIVTHRAASRIGDCPLHIQRSVQPFVRPSVRRLFRYRGPSRDAVNENRTRAEHGANYSCCYAKVSRHRLLPTTNHLATGRSRNDTVWWPTDRPASADVAAKTAGCLSRYCTKIGRSRDRTRNKRSKKKRAEEVFTASRDLDRWFPLKVQNDGTLGGCWP